MNTHSTQKKWVNREHTQTHSYYIESATSASKWKRAAKTEKRKAKKKLRKKITRELTRTLSTVSFSMFGAIKKSNQKNRERETKMYVDLYCVQASSISVFVHMKMTYGRWIHIYSSERMNLKTRTSNNNTDKALQNDFFSCERFFSFFFGWHCECHSEK